MSKRPESKPLSSGALQRQEAAIIRLKERLKSSPMTYYITTMGCQMNAHDSEKLQGILEAMGMTQAENERVADFILYNTCAVRENAELKVYGKIGSLKNLKKQRPELMIALCGCMMQQDIVVEQLKKTYNYVDIVFGTHNVYKLAELIETRLDTGHAIYDIWEDHQEIVEDLPAIRKFPHKAGVNIMYGCNNFCSYCIVPYVRGRERSREMMSILQEIENLVADGVLEIMLLGQNVNSYGKDLEDPVPFAVLLEAVASIKGLKRVRFMTPHPKDLSLQVLEVMSRNENICKTLHLPLQSGSDRLLTSMNRRYTKEQYLAIVEKAKALMPEIVFTTDLIVGYPTETDADHLETLKVVEQVQYAQCYTFIYSKRTGTKAALMDDQIDEATVKRRFDQLLEQVNHYTHQFSQSHIGKTYAVLVDHENHQKEGHLTGRLEDHALVHFKGDNRLISTMVQVKVTDARSFYLTGELIGEDHV